MCAATESSKEINQSPKNHGWAVKAPHTPSLYCKSPTIQAGQTIDICNTGYKIQDRKYMSAIEDTKWEHCIATQQGLAIDYLQTFMPLSRGKVL